MRYARDCLRSRDKLISNFLQWSSTRGHTSISWSAKTYIHQLCADIGHSLEDLPRVADKDGWQEKDKVICTVSITRWWWWKSCTPTEIHSKHLPDSGAGWSLGQPINNQLQRIVRQSLVVSVLVMTLKYNWGSFGEYGVPIHCPLLQGPLWLGVVVPVRVSSMS